MHHPDCKVMTEHAPGADASNNILAANGVRVCGATSSSTIGWGGEPDRAIDGKHCSEYGDHSCTHTDAGGQGDAERHATYETNGQQHPPAWWQVDLGGMAQITRVDIWHRTGCGEANRIDPITGGIAEQSTCNARLEGAHVYVSNTNRDPTTKHMWSLTACQSNPQACTVCGVIHMSAATQPETIECPQGTAGRFVAVTHTWQGEMSIGHNGQQYGGGGSSGGTVITICEAKVFGIRMASHEYNNPQGSCTVYNGQMGGPVQPPPPPPPCASRKSCAQLHELYGGWTEKTAFSAEKMVCGESDNGLGGCGKNQCCKTAMLSRIVALSVSLTLKVRYHNCSRRHHRRRRGFRRWHHRRTARRHCDRRLAARKLDLHGSRRAALHRDGAPERGGPRQRLPTRRRDGLVLGHL